MQSIKNPRQLFPPPPLHISTNEFTDTEMDKMTVKDLSLILRKHD